MNAKNYLIIYYSLAGIVISLCTALMTYYIIDVPIGSKMIFKIFLTIFATLPIIALFSYLIGTSLSRRFTAIRICLNNINEDKFLVEKNRENIRDISAIHDSIYQLSKRLENSISKLKEQNQDLNNLILSLSHDVKTPLTIIDGYLEEIEDNMVDKEQIPKVVSILKKETAYINELSSEVISYVHSKNDVAQKDVIVIKEFLLKEVYPLIRVNSEVELKCKISKNNTIEFNAIALKKILINLLHNASKYTSQGFISVTLERDELIIEDSGIGISKEDSERIFDPFFCLDKSRNREKSGFGLGLSIARNLADKNGYRLTLDSSYLGGCRFILKK